MNLEARTLVDVQASIAFEYFHPVFPVFNFASSGDIRFCSGLLIQFCWGHFPVILRPVFMSPPQGGARCIFRARELSFVHSSFWLVFGTAGGFAREIFYSSAFDPSAFAFCYCIYFSS